MKLLLPSLLVGIVCQFAAAQACWTEDSNSRFDARVESRYQFINFFPCDDPLALVKAGYGVTSGIFCTSRTQITTECGTCGSEHSSIDANLYSTTDVDAGNLCVVGGFSHGSLDYCQSGEGESFAAWIVQMTVPSGFWEWSIRSKWIKRDSYCSIYTTPLGFDSTSEDAHTPGMISYAVDIPISLTPISVEFFTDIDLLASIDRDGIQDQITAYGAPVWRLSTIGNDVYVMGIAFVSTYVGQDDAPGIFAPAQQGLVAILSDGSSIVAGLFDSQEVEVDPPSDEVAVWGEIEYNHVFTSSGMHYIYHHTESNFVAGDMNADGQICFNDIDFLAAKIGVELGDYGYNPRGDLNLDGIIDSDDMDMLIVLLPCAADFNCDGGVDGSDVEAFLTAWELGLASADINRDGGVDGDDTQDFYTYWYASGCD